MSGGKRTRATTAKEIRVRKVHPLIPHDPEELRDLQEDLNSMGCGGLLRYPWRIRF